MIIKHENGYSAKLYGKSSMIIFDPDGRECMHTGFRSCNTKEEVLQVLEARPAFQDMIKKIIEDDDFDDDFNL